MSNQDQEKTELDMIFDDLTQLRGVSVDLKRMANAMSVLGMDSACAKIDAITEVIDDATKRIQDSVSQMTTNRLNEARESSVSILKAVLNAGQLERSRSD